MIVYFIGPEIDSTGQQVTEWTAHQQRCKKKKTKINANDEKYALAA